VRPLTKWGSWQKTYPKLACGLKRGFSFFHHEMGSRWQQRSDHGNELLVAASPRDAIADTHWYREHFDQFLANEAGTEGVEYLDEIDLERPQFAGDIVQLTGSRNGKPVRIKAGFLIDASGPAGYLRHTLKVPADGFPVMPHTEGLYSHFEDVRKFGEMHAPTAATPYPIDDAAVHHVFAGGWIWVLRFNNGITSAGVAATRELATELHFTNGAAAWEKLLHRLPSVRGQLGGAKTVRGFVHAPNLSYRTNRVSGPRWAMLPHTAGFVDPLLSTGFALSLLGIERLAETLGLRNAARFEARLEDYSQRTLAELDFTATLVGALYANMHDFEVFTALSLLYFAASMFGETRRRLGKTADSFLLQRDPQFGPAAASIVRTALDQPLAPEQRAKILHQIHLTIEPFNLARLGDPARNNWYPVVDSDMLEASAKVDASPEEIKELLERSGFYRAER
jgi:FADH2 O2-dependent halogenase